MRVLTLLPHLKQFEALLAQGYDYLAERFASDAASHAFFAQMAKDERAHVGKLDVLGRYAAERPSEFQDVEADLSAVAADLATLRDFVVRIKTVSLAKALAFVLRVEEGAAEKHTRIARACSNRQLAEAMHDLYVADTDHLLRIRQHLDKVGGAAGR